jgi:hypothetical protein
VAGGDPSETFMPHPILAYIDPGSGSLIIQVVIASIIAIPVILRARIAQVARAFRRDRSSAERTDDGSPTG